MCVKSPSSRMAHSHGYSGKSHLDPKSVCSPLLQPCHSLPTQLFYLHSGKSNMFPLLASNLSAAPTTLIQTSGSTIDNHKSLHPMQLVVNGNIWALG